MEMMRHLQMLVDTLWGSVNGAQAPEQPLPGAAAVVGSRKPSAPMQEPAAELQVLPVSTGEQQLVLPPALHSSGTDTPSAISSVSSEVMQVVSLTVEGMYQQSPSLYFFFRISSTSTCKLYIHAATNNCWRYRLVWKSKRRNGRCLREISGRPSRIFARLYLKSIGVYVRHWLPFIVLSNPSGEYPIHGPSL